MITFAPGTVIGDVDFFLERPYTCAAVCSREAVAYRVTRDGFTRMVAEAPQAAATL